MSKQTSVAENYPAGVPGLIYDSSFRDVVSRAAEVAIGFGLGVARGTDPDVQVALPGAGDAIVGVSVFDTSQPTGGYAIGDAVPVITRGRIWVQVEDAVAPGGGVFVRHTAKGDNTTIGAFRSDADATADPVDTAVQLAGAEYLTTAIAGGLALVSINRP